MPGRLPGPFTSPAIGKKCVTFWGVRATCTVKHWYAEEFRETWKK
jgi:hypothetical protein